MEREHGGEGRVPWQMLLAWWQDKTAGSRRLLLPVATIVGLGLLLLWAGNPVTPAPTAPRVLLDHSTEERVPAREGGFLDGGPMGAGTGHHSFPDQRCRSGMGGSDLRRQ